MSSDRNYEPIESVANGRLELPDATDAFNKLRTEAHVVFDSRDMEKWLEKELEKNLVEVGEMDMDPLLATRDEDNEAQDEKAQRKRNLQVARKIEEARNTISTYAINGQDQEKEMQWRLREEEVAARERITFEHQALEAELLSDLSWRFGDLQRVPHDPFSWTVEWYFAPQEFTVNVTSIRGMRDKVRDGYHVVLCSVLDRVGGSTLRFSTGEQNKNCQAALPPMRYDSKSGNVDRFINRSVDMLCPAPALLGTHAVLLFEIWQLRVGKYDPVDRVIGFGYWPLVNRNYRVVEGKFKCPLLVGEGGEGVDTYHQINGLIQDGLQYWLGNIYFEIKYSRKSRDTLEANNRDEAAQNLFGQEKTDSDTLRLERTADDIRSLTFPNLPPRLFFDDVKLEDNDELKVRSALQGASDLRDMNVALWDKRAMLEEEKQALREENRERKSKSLLMDDDPEILEMLIRKEIANRKVAKRKFKDIVYAEDEKRDKLRDSHVLLQNHHQALVSQREFFFMGRRWRDKGQIAWSVFRDDMGYNPGGPWDKTKLVTSVIFCIIGLYMRMVVHSVGKYLWLQFLDIPLTKEEWNFYHIDLRFEFTSRFFLQQTTTTIAIGNGAAIFSFLFLSITFFALIAIFHSLPYFMTRFALWLGIATIFDAPITVISEAAAGNFESGPPFLLYNQLEREEHAGWYGAILTAVLYMTLAIPQTYFVFLYLIFVHLNGRAYDTYRRITYPESCFFLPFDMELSDKALFDLVKRAKKYRSEQGEIKRVTVNDFNHRYTCLFRDRLFKLLSIMNDEPEEWVKEYISKIALRRPPWAQDLIREKLGSFELGSDVLLFMRRNFPHLCTFTSNNVGDRDEDYYYESELIRGITSHNTSVEDEREMREFLESYFLAQVYTGKPAAWDMQDRDVTTRFIVKDEQLLADLIFFETSGAWSRLQHLKEYLGGYMEPFEGAESPEEKAVILPNFDRMDYMMSIEGEPAKGVIIRFDKEDHATGKKNMLRAFVVTPTGAIIEPQLEAFSYLSGHTADHVEFWAAKATLVADSIRDQFEASTRY